MDAPSICAENLLRPGAPGRNGQIDPSLRQPGAFSLSPHHHRSSP
jgi:hypothetical protein